MPSPVRNTSPAPRYSSGDDAVELWSPLAHSLPVTLNTLFQQVAHRAPNSVAVVHPASGGVRSLTYGELDRRSTSLASRLHVEGVGPGRMVGVMMRRSPESIVAMLAVVKSGAAYVPLDAAYPAARLQFMLTDARSSLCLADSTHQELARRLSNKVIVVGERDELALEGMLPQVSSDPETPAYVMYTSGSTGRPKGVVVPHRAIIRLVRDQSFARLDESRVLLHLAPASFDASTFEIWGALLNGGRCVLAPETGIPDLEKLRDVIVTHGVTTVWLTASLFNTIIDHAPATLETVDEVLAGGEALSVRHVRLALELLPSVQIINGYGPTESTTFACCFRVPRPLPESWTAIPIGKAIARTSAQLLDSQLRQVAQGESGELYIGGDGLALGYLNLPELTAERFVDSPDHGRLYRTGDRARALPDGVLEFLGRDDEQVKIRGYRIELGEIEAALRSVPGVANSVVAVREDVPGDKRLVGYYTLADCAQGPFANALREHLTARLPDYMVPSAFAQLDAIPLTPNGKADRRALPAPSRRRPTLDRAPLAARTPLERWIAGLWCEILQLDAVGVHDRFFELGGTSIAALRFLARMNDEAVRPLPALLLFRAPTIAELSDILGREYPDALPRRLANPPAPRAASAVAERTAQRQNELLERRMRRRAT